MIVISADQGALGSTVATFEAKNAALTSCSVFGYFGFDLLDAQGRQIGLPQRDRGLGFPFSEPGKVVLHPGESARFVVQWWGTLVPGGNSEPCTDAGQIEVTAPNQFDHVFVPARLPSGGSVRVCGNGDVFLGPASASFATSPTPTPASGTLPA